MKLNKLKKLFGTCTFLAAIIAATCTTLALDAGMMAKASSTGQQGAPTLLDTMKGNVPSASAEIAVRAGTGPAPVQAPELLQKQSHSKGTTGTGPKGQQRVAPFDPQQAHESLRKELDEVLADIHKRLTAIEERLMSPKPVASASRATKW